MHIKSIVAGAAIALTATIGSASAAEKFTTLNAVKATPLTAAESIAIVGQGNGGELHVHVPENGAVELHGGVVNVGTHDNIPIGLLDPTDNAWNFGLLTAETMDPSGTIFIHGQ